MSQMLGGGFQQRLWRCICLTTLLLAPLAGNVLMSSRVGAYSCLGIHCYNTITWAGITPGGRTTIYSQGMSTDTNGTTDEDFITNEIWLVDTETAGCDEGAFDECWIEAGFIASKYYTSGPARYFYAYRVPRGNFVVVPYSTTTFPVNSWTTVAIIAPFSTRPADFRISFDNDTYNQHFSPPVTNPMTPNLIQIGSELSGTVGSHSQYHYFDLNQYAGANSTWYYQTNDGGLSGPKRNPPSGNWAIRPSQDYQGGQFYSICAC